MENTSNRYMEGFSLEVFMPDENTKTHRHREIELLYNIEGTSVVKVEDASYRLEENQIMVINAGKSHSIRKMTGGGEDMVCCVHISEKMLCEYVGRHRLLFWCNSTKDSSSDNYAELRRVLNVLLVDYMNGKAERYFMRYSQCYALLHLLLTYFLVTENSSDKALPKTDTMDERYEDILHYIDMNYNTEISLGELADEFGLSVSYLSRYLKKKMGMTFTGYLYEVRLRYAVEELLFTDHPVTRLALDHGFPSASVFNKRFREKYGCIPTQYREKMPGVPKDPEKKNAREKAVIQERLKEHFEIRIREEDQAKVPGIARIEADAERFSGYTPNWGFGIGAGPASALLYADVRNAIVYAAGNLGIRYVRIWSLFNEELHIIKDGKWGANRFSRINEIIQFLLDHHMKPFLELGEKPGRILRSADSMISAPENSTNFSDYRQFKSCLGALIRNFVSRFGRREVESWYFEIWEDLRIEVYPDKVPYVKLFADCCSVIKHEAPAARVGGAGNHLGWYREHTEEAVQKWIDAEICPDFLSFDYYPYTAGDSHQERFSRRKYDESDLMHTLDELHGIMAEKRFSAEELLVTDWNMSFSSRNFFHDSLWKGCYVLKCSLESLGKADALFYGQLIDSTTDEVDSQTLINGSGGLLTRDMIEKPAFAAMRMLSLLKPLLVAVGDGYIVTESEDKELSILLFHFINRNYMYYIKQEYENRPEDHYRYFEHLDGKKIELRLRGLPAGQEYIVRHAIVNRSHGSVLDEWNALSCIETPSRDDIGYLKGVCRPKKMLEYRKAEGGSMQIECVLRPLEMRLITLEKRRMPD